MLELAIREAANWSLNVRPAAVDTEILSYAHRGIQAVKQKPWSGWKLRNTFCRGSSCK